MDINPDDDTRKNTSKNLQIFVECGDELRESNIDKLTNNGLLSISNDNDKDICHFDNYIQICALRVAILGCSSVGQHSLVETYIYGDFGGEYETNL